MLSICADSISLSVPRRGAPALVCIYIYIYIYTYIHTCITRLPGTYQRAPISFKQTRTASLCISSLCTNVHKNIYIYIIYIYIYKYIYIYIYRRPWRWQPPRRPAARNATTTTTTTTTTITTTTTTTNNDNKS